MVARELHTRQEFRLWRDELLKLRAAPFNVGKRSLVVAYAVAAEASCFLVLGWPLPVNVVDLYAEHLLDINGIGLAREAVHPARGRGPSPSARSCPPHTRKRCAARSSTRIIGLQMRWRKSSPIAPMTSMPANGSSKQWPPKA